MGEFSNALSASASGLKAQAQRLRHVSENISNVDTPGYQRKSVAFETEFSATSTMSGVKTGPVKLDQTELARIYDPSHPMADAGGNYDGSNVNLLIEIADAREAQRSYEANLKMFEQARQMSSRLMELLRK